MPQCYSGWVTWRNPLQRGKLPRVWLLSDVRNDAALADSLRRLPRGSGFVFRHYHLAPEERRRRFGVLQKLARARGHVVALSGDAALARAWGADAMYGPPSALRPAPGLLRLATVHSLSELGMARRAGADMVFVSPVFATRSHPGGATLGPARALLLARRAAMPVAFLGGMTAARAGRLVPHGWAAIDGLSGRAAGRVLHIRRKRAPLS
nr:thiamine phosphate synthase [uncultured Croceicoccus sp.]